MRTSTTCLAPVAVIATLALGPTRAPAAQAFPSVDEAVAYANQTLADEVWKGCAAVIAVPRVDPERAEMVQVTFHVGYGRTYASVRPGQALVEIMRWPEGSGVRLQALGHHELVHKFAVGPGKILVIDDLALEPIAPGEGAEVLGVVKLEDGVDPEGIAVTVGCIRTETDKFGRFRATGLGAGETSVRASVPNHRGLSATTELRRGGKDFVLLEGWRPRYALVRWAYQPEPTTDLTTGLVTGRGLLDANDLDRISFAQGFTVVTGLSDFLVQQREDRLTIRNFDIGRDPPGIEYLPDISFDEVRKAPPALGRQTHELVEGGVYVFRCFDGEHYAKMEVLRIVNTDEDRARLVSELVRD